MTRSRHFSLAFVRRTDSPKISCANQYRQTTLSSPSLIFETLLLSIEISFFRWLSPVRGLDFGNVVFFGVRRQTGAVEISFVILCGFVLCVIHVSPRRHLSHLANSGGNTLDYVVRTARRR